MDADDDHDVLQRHPVHHGHVRAVRDEPDTAPEPFNQPFFLAFTAALGLGGDAPTANTAARATTKLDWVRVWQYG